MQVTSFYRQIQNYSGLDLRDNRGKKLDFAFVLLSLIIALLRGRDATLSGIQRGMQNTNEALCSFLGLDNKRAISRSYLPFFLKTIALEPLEALLFKNFGLDLKSEERAWFADDGQELRASIKKGDKRGEALVQLVKHSDREVLAQRLLQW